LEVLYQKIGRYLPFTISVAEEADPRHSSALATQWGIYLNAKSRFVDGCVSKKKRSRLANEIKHKLKNLKDKAGSQVFKGVFLRGEIYKGKRMENAPDIIFCPQTEWQIDASLSNREIFCSRPANDHEIEGIFLAVGADIAAGKFMKEINLADICPTILYCLRVSLPEYLDGNTLNIFRNRRGGNKTGKFHH